MMRGKLIVIEGTDCSGKETQANLLEENLNKIGKQTKKLYFPKYETATGIIVGACFLGQKELCDTYLNNQYGWFEEGSSKVDGMVSSLYYAADRKYNIKEINDLLNKGYKLPKKLLPMNEVVSYLKINISYLQKMTKDSIGK